MSKNIISGAIIFFSLFVQLQLFSQQHKHHTFTIVQHENKFGLVSDESGKSILPIEFDTIINLLPSGGLYLLEKQNKYGIAKYVRSIKGNMQKMEIRDSNHWETTTCVYDTIMLYNEIYKKTLILEKEGKYEYNSLEMFYITQMDAPSTYTRSDRAFIQNVYYSQNAYDTIIPDLNILYLKVKNLWGIHLVLSDKEIECQWDSITQIDRIPNKLITYILVWKNGKAAILNTSWDINHPEVAKSRNYILTTPYNFTNETKFDLFADQVNVNVQKGQISIFNMHTLNETKLHSKEGLFIRKDSSLYYQMFTGYSPDFQDTLISLKGRPDCYYTPSYLRDEGVKKYKRDLNIEKNTVQYEVYLNTTKNYITIYYFDKTGNLIESFDSSQFIYSEIMGGLLVVAYDCSLKDNNIVPVHIHSVMDNMIIKSYNKKNRIYEVTNEDKYSVIYSTKFNSSLVNIETTSSGSEYTLHDGRMKKKKIGYIIYDKEQKTYRVVRFKWMAE